MVEDQMAKAFRQCADGNFEDARSVIEKLSVPELKAMRQACAYLDNEIFCLVETAIQKPKAGE